MSSKSYSASKSVITASSSKLMVSSKASVATKADKMASPSYSSFDSTSAGSLKFVNMPKIWSKVEISLENSLLNEEKFNNPPSLSDGMSADMERDLRFLGCELIQSASILLKLPQVAAATGQILYQRFYYCKSFVRYNFEQSAMACVNLASKIEEAPRRIRDVINVFHHLKQLNRIQEKPSLHRRPHPLVVDQKYVAIKNEVIKAERRVLKELGFCVHVKHPHKLIVSYLYVLRSLEKQGLLQKAWNYMNDSLRSDIFLRVAPEVIACACIHLASLNLSLPLPSAEIDVKMTDGSIQTRICRWWDLFAPQNVSVPDVCRQLLRLYSRRHKPKWEKLEAELTVMKHLLLEKQAANKIAGGVENTPNPHVFSSTVLSDQKASGSPKEKRSPSSRRYADYSRHERREHKRAGRVSNGILPDDTKEASLYKESKPRRRRRESRSSSSPSSSDDEDRRRGSGAVGAAFKRRPIDDEYDDASAARRRQRRFHADAAAGDELRRRGGRRHDDSAASSLETSKRPAPLAGSHSPSRSPTPPPPDKRVKRTRRRSPSGGRMRLESDRRKFEVREALRGHSYNINFSSKHGGGRIRDRRGEFNKR